MKKRLPPTSGLELAPRRGGRGGGAELKALNERLSSQNEELARSESDLANLMASVRLPIIMFDRELCIRRFTAEAEAIFQLAPSDVGQSIKELALDFAIPNLISKLTAVVKTGLPQEQEIRNREGHWFVLRMRPEFSAAAGTAGVVMVLVDIDELKRNQLEVTAARDYSDSIVSTIDDALIVLDEAWQVVSANPAYFAFFQPAAAHTVGQNFFQIGERQWNRPELVRALGQVQAAHLPLRDWELEATFPRIGKKTLRLRAQPIPQAPGSAPLLLLALSDITERRAALEALELSERRSRESAERFRFTAESMPQKIFTARPSGEVDYFNPLWMEFTGLSFEQIRGWGWRQFLHPEDEEQTMRLWSHSTRTGEPYLQEHRFRRADGVYRWHLSRGTPLRDPEGQIMMWIGSNTEIHDQKEAEKRLEDAVEHRTAELKSMIGELETFSYALAHDLRGPLRTMQGFAEALREDYASALDEQGHRFVGKISAAADRMQQLIGDVLIFTRMTHQPLPVEPVNLDHLMATIFEQYLESRPAGITVQPNLGVVTANPPALVQAISNLLNNALKFTADGREPAIEVRTEAQGEWVVLSINDNGIGVASEDHARIFRIFERAVGPNEYEGTGIGLAIVRRTVERMGGTVGVNSTPGLGSSFWIRLPGGALSNE